MNRQIKEPVNKLVIDGRKFTNIDNIVDSKVERNKVHVYRKRNKYDERDFRIVKGGLYVLEGTSLKTK